MKVQFLRFLIVGGIAATVNFCSRIALSHWLPYVMAIVLAYGCGLVTAFILNRRYVFIGAANHVHQQAFRFVMVNALALAQTLAISLVFARYALPAFGVEWYRDEIAHALGVITPVFTSFVAHKRWSFRTAE